MDRFIGLTEPPPVASGENLKSNMDRFIDLFELDNYQINRHLKSNMDRFIEKLGSTAVEKIKLFKIQYG